MNVTLWFPNVFTIINIIFPWKFAIAYDSAQSVFRLVFGILLHEYIQMTEKTNNCELYTSSQREVHTKLIRRYFRPCFLHSNG